MRLIFCFIWLFSWVLIPAFLYSMFGQQYGMLPPLSEQLKGLAILFGTTIIGIIPLAFKLALGGNEDIVLDQSNGVH
jgi:hypothetical protein